MSKMSFGRLQIDPARNPAVLDTATWHPPSAWEAIHSLDHEYWCSVQKAAGKDRPLPASPGFAAYSGSLARYKGNLYFLAGLKEGQLVFIEIGARAVEQLLGEPLGTKQLGEGCYLRVYPTDAEVVDRFCRFILPEKGPKALGLTHRLGIGVRMSTSVWPGVWSAMAKYDFAANAIQNSLRELNLLADVLAGRPALNNYLFSFGNIEEGHTGSTFEGLWVAGVLEALKCDTRPLYGADADHIQVKRGPDGLERAKRVIEAARYYTFFTLDVSDILDYGALSNSVRATEYLEQLLSEDDRKAILTQHRKQRRFGGESYCLSEKEIGCLVGKYWQALNALQELYAHLKGLKSDIPFDLELSIDENPPEIQTCESITAETELIFLSIEAQRRQIPLTHIAPNFGVEKGVDYRCTDGLEGLAKRTGRLHRIASERGLMLDCHSGDDLSSQTRKVFGRATAGKIHFKISPSLQMLFAETLHELQPQAFRRWWEATREYVKDKAEAGSDFAVQCLKEVGERQSQDPSPHDRLFHYYHFAPVGLRDAAGQFINRELFYGLSPDFYSTYQSRVEAFLGEVAEDVFNHGA